jgi:hypothetical protein
MRLDAHPQTGPRAEELHEAAAVPGQVQSRGQPGVLVFPAGRGGGRRLGDKGRRELRVPGPIAAARREALG